VATRILASYTGLAFTLGNSGYVYIVWPNSPQYSYRTNGGLKITQYSTQYNLAVA